MSTRVSGSSDDLIEIDGDICEEFTVPEDDMGLLAFNDGTVLRIAYTASGVWRITPVAGQSAKIVQAPEDDEDNYTDVATIEDVSWVMLGTAIAHRDLGRHPHARPV